MNIKKFSAGILGLSMVFGMAAAPSAAGVIEAVPVSVGQQEEVVKLLAYAKYGSFTGTIKSILAYDPVPGSHMVNVESKDGRTANMIIASKTLLTEDVRLETGQIITGWYDADKPMIMIYPPQYTVELVTSPASDLTIKADHFDKNLVSRDGMLKLNLSKETVLVDQDGKVYKESLTDKNLLVYYGISTKSIPAQTVPEKIFVMEEKLWLKVQTGTQAGLIGEAASPEGHLGGGNISRYPLWVGGKKVAALPSYMKDEKNVMVPLRAIAEALGYEVIWNAGDISVQVGKAVLKIGADDYHFAKMAPVKLGAAPEIRNNRTFVPIQFFKQVLQINNAYVFEGQIVVDNGEVME